MLPLHAFGKARQAELRKLAESSASALEQETEWFERADWKQAPSFDAAVELCETISPLAKQEAPQPGKLKEGVFSKFLRMLAKVQQALRMKAHT